MDGSTQTATAAKTWVAESGSEQLVGLTSQTSPARPQALRFFDADSPGVTTGGTITGVPSNQTLIGLDTRPATNQLYAVARTSNRGLRLYTIDPANGAATSLGRVSTVLGFGFTAWTSTRSSTGSGTSTPMTATPGSTRPAERRSTTAP